VGFRNSETVIIGTRCRISTTMNTANRTADPARQETIGADHQQSRFASISPYVSRNTAAPELTRPAMSIRCSCEVSRDSGTTSSARATPATPTGTLT
jgi:hypothetical protein